MEIEELIKKGKDFVEEKKRTNTLKNESGYNLFNLSSYNNHKENFHTDVIASLLHYGGLHKEGNIFLQSFIDFLNTKYPFNIDKEKYQKAEVIREWSNINSRIDIIIKGDGVCIIIENKMNNAPDMDNQLERYYNIAKEEMALKVNAIIYLTLDGIKQAPKPVNEEIEKLIKNIGAFTNDAANKTDLVNGWLYPCYKASKNDDSKSLINEYTKLVKHLNASCMEKLNIEKFYQLVDDSQTIENVKIIDELSKQIPLYRMLKIKEGIGDSKPFRESFRYANYNAWLFDKFDIENNSFKFSIEVYESGNVMLHFFNPPFHNTKKGTEEIKKLLESIEVIKHFFKRDNESGYQKDFILGEGYKTMQQIDIAVIDFVKNLFTKLKEPVKIL